jgi:hypothetical protein
METKAIRNEDPVLTPAMQQSVLATKRAKSLTLGRSRFPAR